MRGRRLLRAACGLVLVAVLVTTGGTARGARDDAACNWGASSITATYLNGELVQSQPHATGCTP